MCKPSKSALQYLKKRNTSAAFEPQADVAFQSWIPHVFCPKQPQLSLFSPQDEALSDSVAWRWVFLGDGYETRR